MYGPEGDPAFNLLVYLNSNLRLETIDAEFVSAEIHTHHIHFAFEMKLAEGDTINLVLPKDDYLVASYYDRISFTGQLLFVE